VANHHVKSQESVTVEPGVKLVGRAKLPNIGRFAMVYESLELLIRDNAPELFSTVVTLRSMVNYENQVVFSQSSLAEDMKVTRLTISRHIKRMRELGLIVPDPREHNMQAPRVWRLHPKLVWRGNGETIREYLKELPTGHVFTLVGKE
jgi:biotin operon repressor